MKRLPLLMLIVAGACAGSPESETQGLDLQPTTGATNEDPAAEDPAVRAARLAVKIANGRATPWEKAEYERYLINGN